MKALITQIINEWESFQNDGSLHPWNKDCPAKGRLDHFAGKMASKLGEQAIPPATDELRERIKKRIREYKAASQNMINRPAYKLASVIIEELENLLKPTP